MSGKKDDNKPESTEESLAENSATEETSVIEGEVENDVVDEPVTDDSEIKDEIETEEVATGAIEADASESNKEAATPPAAAAPAKQKTSKLGAVSLVLSLATLGAVGAGGYWAWQQWQGYSAGQVKTVKVLEQQIADQQNLIASLQGELSTQQSNIAKNRDSVTSVIGEVQDDQQLFKRRLESHSNRLQSLSGTSRNDWLLAEARYLLRLANQRLLMERATEGAQALLESADQILVSIDDIDLFNVRDAIAKDIVALKLAPDVDREGVFLKLSAMSQQLDAIPAIPPSRTLSANEAAPQAEASTADEDAPAKWYDTALTSIVDGLQKLDKYVQVRRLDEPPKPTLSADQQSYMIHNLRLLFEQAQLALLREQETIYRDSLQQAQDWINTYYSHYDNRASFIKEIAAVQKLPIRQQLPDISGSLKQLTQYIERYHKLTPEAPLPDQQDAQANSQAKQEAAQ